MGSIPATIHAGTVARVCGRAREALLRLRSDDGLWRDVRTAAGTSDEWVTAFVLAHLDPEADAIAESIAALSRRQHNDGGWGYSASVPSDADSTAWAILALARTDSLDPAASAAAVGLLVEHQQPNGGFATYRAALRPQRAELRPTWFTAQACVTATAMRALLAAGTAVSDEPVLRAQRWLVATAPDWDSTWWPDPAYTRHHGTRALQATHLLPPEHAAILHGRANASVLRDEPGRTRAFGLAQDVATLTALGAAPTDPAFAFGVDVLCKTQAADGTWPSQPILRVPDDRPGVNHVAADHRRVLTTAAALGALLGAPG